MRKLFEWIIALVPFHVMVVPNLGAVDRSHGLHYQDRVLFSNRMSAVSATRGSSQLGTYLGTHLATSVLPADMNISSGLFRLNGWHSVVLTRMMALSAVGCMKCTVLWRAGRHRFGFRCDGY